jgi:3-oxoacyl-[acyl-carrier-protein] synthase-1
MRRVVVTGLGIISSIGNNKDEVVQSLKDGRSGIEYCPEYEELGFRSHVHGSIKLNIEDVLDRKLRRFMGDGAAYNYLAMGQAIEDAGLTEQEVSNERSGIIMGSGGPSTKNMLQAFDTMREKGARRVGPFMVPRTMSNTNTATLAVPYKIKGMNYTITSACATSSHCIGHGAELIQWDKQDIVFAGGGEELHWTITVLFDAMPALSSKYNDRSSPAAAAWWCSKSWSTPRRAAPRFMPSSSAMAPPRTATTWFSPPARARSGACAWHSKGSATRRSITSTPTAPAPRSATPDQFDQVAHRPRLGRCGSQ